MLIESSEEDPRIPLQPFEPGDLEDDGDVKDSKLSKYSGEDDEDKIFKDKTNEFSSCGAGSIVGYAGTKK